MTAPLTDNGKNGWIDNDLKLAIKNALRAKPEGCHKFAEGSP